MRPYVISQWLFTKRLIYFLTIFFVSVFFISPVAGQQTMTVQLAKVFKGHDVNEYLVSEKYDGVRAIWRNNTLFTRHGHEIHAPAWFTENWPDTWLDGELWFERNNFEYVMSTVSKDKPIDSEWQKIRYMVFDKPDYVNIFEMRYLAYLSLINATDSPYLIAVKQFSMASNHSLYGLLTDYVDTGAEGLMLHKKDALFGSGRTGNLVKLKTHMDSEALVVKHYQGNGKYSEMLGAMLVRWFSPTGKEVYFKIGSGFSDLQRSNPPSIGSKITFKYYGLTKRGVPKYASFIRAHDEG